MSAFRAWALLAAMFLHGRGALCVPYEAEELRIGGLFHTMDVKSVTAFLRAIELVNMDEVLLPHHRLVGVNLTVPELDALQAHRTVCELLSDGRGVVAVLGPAGDIPATYTQSVLDAMEVPHLSTRPGERVLGRRGMLHVNLHPSADTLAEMFADVVPALGWVDFTVVYTEPTALARLSDLLKMNGAINTVTIRQLPPGEDYRRTFKELKMSGSTSFVVDCPIERLNEVLVQMQQCGLLVPPFSFFFTNLEFTTLDLTPFQFGGANITGLRLVKDPPVSFGSLASPSAPPYAPYALSAPYGSYGPYGGSYGPSSASAEWPDEAEGIRLQAALFHDGVLVLGHALHNLQHDWLTTRPLDCEAAGDSWEHGASLINYIRTTEVHGLSGLVKFDNAGRRSDVAVEVVELSEEGLEAVAVWNITEGLNMTRPSHRPWLQHAPHVFNQNSIYFNRTLIVLIAMTPPYAMLKEDSASLSGDKRFEGFGIELIDQLARMLGFNYTFVVQEDGNYGTCDPDNGTCTGMMAEVDSGRADLAIVDLTITSERESRVDFTTPFLSLGIQVLYRKPQRLPPSLMSFLSPFSNDVWLLITAAYIGVSMLMFAMARISPYEWNNPYPCIDNPTELENQFSLRNAFWFTIGSIMQQGSEIAPIAASLRMAASSWWLFTLIMVSSYTANLAAFLTVDTQFSRIKSAEDLADQTYIKYGAKMGGSTQNFFKATDNPVYHKMHEQMMRWDQEGLGVSQKNNEEGLERVARGDDYAFLMESAGIEYMMERNCNVTSVGSLLDEKGYGIAMAKNAPFRSTLSAGVLSMQETGQMMEMKDKWWKNKRGGGACQAKSKEGVELDMDNVGGVFLVLVSGCVLAIFIAFAELTLNVHRTCVKEDLSFPEEMLEELHFIVRGGADVKPVRHLRIRDAAAINKTKQPLEPSCEGDLGDSPEIILGD